MNESVLLTQLDSLNSEIYTQTAHKLLQLMLTVDQSLPERSRVKSIDQVIINYDALFGKTQVAELNTKFKGKWIANDKLNTSFSDWIYTLKFSNDSISKPYIYEKPSLDSKHRPIPPDDIVVDKSSVDKQISIIRCKGQWVNAIVKVNGKEYKGWLPYYNLCHNKVTSCHHGPESGIENVVE